MPAFQGMWPRWRQAARARRAPRRPLLRPEPGPQGDRTPARRWLPGGREPLDGRTALAAARRALPARVRAGDAGAASRGGWRAPAAGRRRCSPRWRTGSSRSTSRATRRGWPPVTPSSPRRRRRGLRLLPYFDAYVVGCQPRDRLFPGRAARAGARPAARPATTRCCSSTAWSPACGTNAAPAADPRHRRAARAARAAQQRALEEEVERVGEILEGKPSLTIGTVSVGPHA